MPERKSVTQKLPIQPRPAPDGALRFPVVPPEQLLSGLYKPREVAGGSEQKTITLVYPDGVTVTSLRPILVWTAASLSKEDRDKIRRYKVTVINANNDHDLTDFNVDVPKGTQENVLGQVPRR